MLAAFYYNNHDVRVEEIPVPSIGEDEALLKVMASGICGSDVLEWYRVPKAPRVLGHEATGVISKVGSKVKNVKVGDRVFVSHHVPCNTMPILPTRKPHSLPHTAHNQLLPRRLCTVHPNPKNQRRMRHLQATRRHEF